MLQERLDYTPIDYKNWTLGDPAREGINLKRLGLLNQLELAVWENAIPYQDQRDDPGQGEIVTYFTLKLLEFLPGNREVVVPAAILHDTGFYGYDSDAWKKLVSSGKKIETEENRRPHQNRGILLAGRILERVNYPEEYHFEIADIIGDHDTRKLPTTQNGTIVRSADQIWRLTYPCLSIYHPDLNPGETLKKLEESALNLPPPFDLGRIENQIARLELTNTMLFAFGNGVIPMLSAQYKNELDLISKR